MKLVLFGASGMVGAGTLRTALASADVETVLTIGRTTCGVTHPKLRELLLPDLFEITPVKDQLTGYDACIWTVGVSSLGLDEAAYSRVTEELTLAWARTLLELSPGLSFCYCSGAGAGGSAMWARVRQRVERALQTMPFRHVGVVRPGFIQPAPGIRSRTRLYQAGIVMMKPFYPLFVRVVPSLFTTSEVLARAMLRVVQGKADRYILESADINRLGSPR